MESRRKFFRQLFGIGAGIVASNAIVKAAQDMEFTSEQLEFLKESMAKTAEVSLDCGVKIGQIGNNIQTLPVPCFVCCATSIMPCDVENCPESSCIANKQYGFNVI